MKKNKKIITFLMMVCLLFIFTGCASLDYKKGSKLMDEGKFAEAQEVFSQITDYKDSSKLLETCKYKQAEQLIDEENFTEAKQLLNELKDYEGTDELLKECNYDSATKALAANNYEEAAKQFSSLGNYKDAADKLNECNYQLAVKLLNENNFSEAVTAFTSLAGYKDSAEKINECNYSLANELFEKSDYKGAAEIYKKLGEYLDASEKIDSCDYQIAEDFLENKEYEAAAQAFEKLGDYMDSADKSSECKYEMAVEMYENENYETAAEIFEELGEYSDSSDYLAAVNSILNPIDLTGVWTCKYNLGDLFRDELAAEIGGDYNIDDYFDFTKFEISINLEFYEDSNFSMAFDTNSFIKALKKQMKKAFPKLFTDVLEKEAGMSIKEILAIYGFSSIDDIFPLVLGMSLDDYIESNITSIEESITASLPNYDGTYIINGSNILLTLSSGDTDTGIYDETNDTISFDATALDLGWLVFTK